MADAVIGAVLLGIGTAMVYPTLLAAIGDVTHPAGAPHRSACIDSGATSDTRSARCSRACSPMHLGLVRGDRGRRRRDLCIGRRGRDSHARDAANIDCRCAPMTP